MRPLPQKDYPNDLIAMRSTFKKILKGKVIVLGVGNIMRGDDGFGPALIENLSRPSGRAESTRKFIFIDAGSAPENYLGKIIKEKPDTVLIVDAVHLNLSPGKYELLKKAEIANCGLTTHDISPGLFIDFLEKETDADIYFLGLQPKNITLGDDMSVEVKKSVIELSGLIKGVTNA